MSDGIKAWHEDMEEAAEREASEKFQRNFDKLDRDWLRRKVDKLTSVLKQLEDEDLTIKKHQHELLDHAMDLIKEFNTKLYR
jgi:mRNA-degrading endonuclease YafQ of YafQ-DinJ toxin-antitoxin module